VNNAAVTISIQYLILLGMCTEVDFDFFRYVHRSGL
jgi:hypothetical protein